MANDKLADGSVTDTKLGVSAVTSSKIAAGAVVTGSIAAGAITDDKITGPISASKISDGVFQKKYANVIVVAKSGGDFSDPVAAINSITDSSVTNPYLVKIMPGIYDIGEQSINLPQSVDIEGSGSNVTKIIASSVVLWPRGIDSVIKDIYLESGIWAIISDSSFTLKNSKIIGHRYGAWIRIGTMNIHDSEVHMSFDGPGAAVQISDNGTSRIYNSKITTGIGDTSIDIASGASYLFNTIIDGFSNIPWGSKCLNVVNLNLDTVACN